MQFEHLVQINDPQLTDVRFLSRAQVWFGLVARAYKPEKFILGLVNCTIHDRQQNGETTVLSRSLNYGSFVIHDTIALHEGSHTENNIAANEFCGDSCMTIRIEEPEPQQLWLRFRYEVGSPEHENPESELMQAQMDEARRQAYRAADIDTVKMIRELALSVPEDGQSGLTH
ncbi:MAG TPA: SRPBCC family protein [Limnobacter sp.]|uniref:SRPBCC family protein n=1 Tax=Limnobacter sp. TaxID=2003368 RepID=UPI002E302274|nr:SRPBCC family protein [Limnobacter sp.]HEX5486610.1 SRPBCC family protein [Limnobacter sp.]